MTQTPTTNDDYADRLLREAARMMLVRCPRSAMARLRRIAQHDAETYGADYEEALAKRKEELNNLLIEC